VKTKPFNITNSTELLKLNFLLVSMLYYTSRPFQVNFFAFIHGFEFLLVLLEDALAAAD